MKAVVQTKYGSPEVLELREVETPTPKANEVLIKIHAASVTAAHTMMRRGVPRFGRLFIGLTKPKISIPGTDLAGEVEAVGKDVTRFKKGDQVFGATDLGGGCYAEYVCLPEDEVLALKPTTLSFEEATTILDGAMTSLHFLRDKGHIKPGQSVLVNGASGSLGTAAVQLAKHFGAEVTGVCSTRNVDMVKSIGADRVIDYRQEDFTKNASAYDIIFDTVGKSSFARSKGALKRGGVYLSPILNLPLLFRMLWTSKVGSKKARFAAAGLRSQREKIEDLGTVVKLLEAGALKPVIDRCYPLEKIVEAHRYVDGGHKKGNVAITFRPRHEVQLAGGGTL